MSRATGYARPAVARKQRAGRDVAHWFVPNDRMHLAVRDLALRLSVWPIASAIVRRSIDAGPLPPAEGPTAEGSCRPG